MNIMLPFIHIGFVIRFPERLFILLLLLLVAALLGYDMYRRRKIFFLPWYEIRLSSSILPGWRKRFFWWFFASIAFALLVFVFSAVEKRVVEYDPVYGHVRITFFYDDSLSVWFADEKPNRMEVQKQIVREMVKSLQEDPELRGRYSMAIIPFAGSASYLFLPFTTSYDEFFAALDEISPETVTAGGTSILAALLGYTELLFQYPSPGGEITTEIVFLVSDGGKEEGHGGEPRFFPEAIRNAERAAHPVSLFDDKPNPKTIIINTIGVGKFEDRLHDGKMVRIAVPTKLVVRDKAGSFIRFLRKDDKNPASPALSSELDEEILQYVAKLGGGVYMHAVNREQILSGFKKSILTHRKKIAEIPRDRYEPVAHWFLVLAFILLFFLFGYANWMKRLVTYIAKLPMRKVSR